MYMPKLNNTQLTLPHKTLSPETMVTPETNATFAMKKKTMKKKSKNPETQFQLDLNLCSKNNDLRAAIALYESHTSRLNHNHFNALLYLCSASASASASDPSLKDFALYHGFRIFDRMASAGVAPSEATITAVARLAAAKSDGDYAFALVKGMGRHNALPRLRTYDPALFCFVENSEAEKAYEVEAHMASVGLSPEEPEIAALLRVSAEAGREDKVYEYLHKLRGSVRCVSESTAEVIEAWFGARKAGEAGGGGQAVAETREAVLRNGGGWHGQGWIGEGEWVVRRGGVDSSARCCCCGDKLFCVDIDDEETDRFARSVALLALDREVKSNFSEFQDWLDKHADYEAIVDGANVGLYQQNFADGGFSVSQLDAVVKELYNRSGKRWPLVVLHNKRSRSLLENPSSRNFVNDWLDKGILYTTPNGSNDDWYWLYATVKLKCLLVTNDEMRDHIFELLGSSFFLKWKERHQVRYTLVKGNLQLHMPPNYSSVIQESEKGSWHVPLAAVDGIEESERTWLCVTRPGATNEALHVMETFQNSDSLRCDNRPMESRILIACGDTSNTKLGSPLASDDKIKSVTGKRKERSPSSS